VPAPATKLEGHLDIRLSVSPTVLNDLRETIAWS